MGSGRDEIIGPDVISVLRASSYAGAVIQPEATAFGLFLRHLQPLLSPNSFHPLMMNSPALRLKQGGDPTIPLPPLRPCKAYNRLHQCFLITTGVSLIPLSGSRLPQHLTCVSFGHAQSLTDRDDRTTSSGGA